MTPKKPWSIDANLMHIRCGDLTLYAPVSKLVSKFHAIFLNLKYTETPQSVMWTLGSDTLLCLFEEVNNCASFC